MSLDPSQPITNQVKATYQANNHGGGLGGGSASSYKRKSKKNIGDKFTLSEEMDKELTQELSNKSLTTLIKELILSIYANILILLGIKKESTEESEDIK